MKNLLSYELIRFASSKKNLKAKLKYFFLGLVFYPFLAKSFSYHAQASDTASSSQAGDDIYPLF